MSRHIITFEAVTFVDRTSEDMMVELDDAQISQFVGGNGQFFGREDGLVAIRKVYATEDDNQGSDVKMFVSIDLEMDVDDDVVPYDVEPIEDLLEALSHQLFQTDSLDLDYWENADSEPVRDASAAITA